ncbi:MFS transporter [Limnochorda pilosa]|uniref:MFS transporter n=1 Tax=Limnochorda pilosa TaxID=1555112 RepID=A0A0K2SLV3_LIMPI|nr:MFS transporter [Limnochorda pilosa]BAS27804.1 hypothetical protein LIP_1963 [Limnochorda pilosa]
MPAPQAGSLSGLGVLRAKRDFARIWAGQVVSRFGDALDVIAFMWIILELTGSTLMMGTLVVVNTLPSIFLGPFAGVLVDRWSRRRVMIACDVGRGLVTLSVAALWALGSLPVWMLFVVTFVNSIFEVFELPARGAVVPLMVGRENLVAANAIYGFASSLAQLFGLGAAGVVVASLGVTAAVVTDAVTFFLSALSVVVSAVPELERERLPLKIRPFLRELGEGLAFVRSEKVVLFAIVLAGVVNFALGPLNALMPVFARGALGLGPEALSLIFMGFTAGALVGAALVGQIFKGTAEVILLRWGMVGVGLAYGLLGLVPSAWAAVAVAAGMGLAIPFAQAGFSSLVQRRTPEDRMGRVSSLMGTLVLAAMPLSAGVAGAVAERVSIPIVFASLGVLVMATSAALLWTWPFRELRREAAEKASAPPS